MKQTKTLDFCSLTFHDNYVIGIIDEGININDKLNLTLINVIEDVYKKRPFVYISHRINSYSVDPTTYKKTSESKNLIGFAVVSEDYKAKVNAQIEKLFLNKPFEVFSNLNDATSWADEHVLEANKDLKP